MIVKPKVPWVRMLFNIRTTSLWRTVPRILFFAGVSVIVTAIALGFDLTGYSLTATPFTIIGLALGIFLGFRNNAAYDRFWEGRKLWGQLVNSTRTFARQVFEFVGLPVEDDGKADEIRALQDDLIRRMIAYVHALRHHLRDSDPSNDLRRFPTVDDLDDLQQQKNVPIAILQEIGLKLRKANRDGWLTDYHFASIEETMVTITDVQGGCERIKNTPIPYSYTILTHRLVAFYCLFLPLGIVDVVRWLTPVVVVLVAHAFFGLDEIGNEIEDPFGTEPHHLPLSALCRTIEVNLLQSIDEPNVPLMLQPSDGVLL